MRHVTPMTSDTLTEETLTMVQLSNQISRLRRLSLSVVTAAFVSMPAIPFAHGTEDPAAFYAGKSVDVIVGSAAGGGYDAYSRLLARHMDRHIPGHPNLIVRNMEGASGVRAANYLYNVAPKDGSTIGTVQRAVLVEPVFGTGPLKIDSRRWSWIGGLNTEWSVALAWHTSGLNSLEDALKAEFPVATDAPTSDDYIYPAVLNNVLGTRFRIIPGYKGKSEERLSLERGETAGMIGWAWSAAKATAWDQVQSGQLKVILFLAPQKRPEFENVPTVYDYAQTDEQRQILDFIFAPQVIGRPFFGPPGIPDRRLAALRTAFAATIADPDFAADAEKQRLDIEPVTAEELAARVRALYETPPAIVEKAKAARAYRAPPQVAHSFH